MRAEVVLPVAVREYALQINGLAWIQRRPFSDLLFQRTVPVGALKQTSHILPDGFEETISQRQARRGREASSEYE